MTRADVVLGTHKVTALDVSRVALDRATAQAEKAGARITCLHTGLVEAGLAPGSFDLVTAQYPALLRTETHDAESALVDAVAPGGVLLVVHHVIPTDHQADPDGLDPNHYVSPTDVAAKLRSIGGDWHIEVEETRPRHVAAGAGAHHTEDIVLRARRLA